MNILKMFFKSYTDTLILHTRMDAEWMLIHNLKKYIALNWKLNNTKLSGTFSYSILNVKALKLTDRLLKRFEVE